MECNKRIITLLIVLVELILIKHVSSGHCPEHETCGECIRSPFNCSWCGHRNFKHSRCDDLPVIRQSGCPESSIEAYSNKIIVIKNEKLSQKKVANLKEAIQVQPQRIELKLRIKQPVNLKLFYKQAVDYPVDLYYLMDLSRTMLNHKQTLASLGNNLANQMKKITQNFRLGFGSFVDKTVLPFTDTHPSRLQSPCISCSKVYGYRHHMQLNTNTSLFLEEVEKSAISGNIDGPEGGLDAIMQSIVCDHLIGWRRDARHLLIYTSDASFHFAGDGRLAGILRANDEECHLDEQGYYTHTHLLDYPTINQIDQVSQKHNVHIIFAIVGPKIDSYSRLDQRIKSSSLAQLKSDSSNIVNIIRGEYDKIRSTISLSDNSSEYVKISYFTSCFDNQLVESSTCQDVQVDDQLEFQIIVEAIRCPLKGNHKERVKINPIGLDEGLILDIEIISSCDCEKSSQAIKSRECNEKGVYECGICQCDDDAYGNNCECSSINMEITKNDEKCYPPSTNFSENGSKICSGRGHCICGHCSCFQTNNHLYSGKYCECDDMNCNYNNGKLCGGIDHGKCDCGECICNDKWTGVNCECSTQLTSCINPVNGKVCNDRGQCKCGSCLCENYSGPYCDECSTCEGQCPLLAKIVENQIISSKKEIHEHNLTSYLTANITFQANDLICKFIASNQCVYAFKYRHIYPSKSVNSSIKIIIEADEKGTCKEAANITLYSTRFIALFIVIGVFTLIAWRVATFLIDRHEYNNFIKSCKSINFPESENPLYKPSTTTFMNPKFSN